MQKPQGQRAILKFDRLPTETVPRIWFEKRKLRGDPAYIKAAFYRRIAMITFQADQYTFLFFSPLWFFFFHSRFVSLQNFILISNQLSNRRYFSCAPLRGCFSSFFLSLFSIHEFYNDEFSMTYVSGGYFCSERSCENKIILSPLALSYQRGFNLTSPAL